MGFWSLFYNFWWILLHASVTTAILIQGFYRNWVVPLFLWIFRSKVRKLVDIKRIQELKQMYKIPKSLALIVASDDVSSDDNYQLLEKLVHLIRWSSLLGVRHLILYDEEGRLSEKKPIFEKSIRLLNKIHHLSLLETSSKDTAENNNRRRNSEVESIDSGHCSLDTSEDDINRNNEYNLQLKGKELSRKTGFNEPVFGLHVGNGNGYTTQIHFLSGKDGRGHVVQLAREYVKTNMTVTLTDLEKRIQEDFSFPDPELVIRLTATPCLFSFLPWQIRLTEIIPFDETGYRGGFQGKLKELLRVSDEIENDLASEAGAELQKLKDYAVVCSVKILDNLTAVLSRYSKCEQRLGK